MVLNSDKCHFMCLGQNIVNETFVYDSIEMKNSKEKRILGVIIDNKLRFRSHVKNLCKKASQKIWALSRLINYLNDSKKKMIFNALIKSQLSYCPSVWLFCSRQTNNMINKIHERTLRIGLNDLINDFETMLRNMNDTTIHHRNTQTLMIELFKIKYDLAPPIMDSTLNRRTICYNFRNLQDFQSERKRTTSYRASQLWTNLPEEFKQRKTISLFKSDVRQWICNECLCRLCKVFVSNLGIIWGTAPNLVLNIHHRFFNACTYYYASRQAWRYMLNWKYIGICCYLTCISLHLPILSL